MTGTCTMTVTYTTTGTTCTGHTVEVNYLACVVIGISNIFIHKKFSFHCNKGEFSRQDYD